MTSIRTRTLAHRSQPRLSKLPNNCRDLRTSIRYHRQRNWLSVRSRSQNNPETVSNSHGPPGPRVYSTRRKQSRIPSERRMKEESFKGELIGGHKAAAVQVPFDPAK